MSDNYYEIATSVVKPAKTVPKATRFCRNRYKRSGGEKL